MNYKHIAIIALVLMLACVIPASAVWSNGNWIASEQSEQYFGTAKIVTDPATGVTSKYNPVVDSNPNRSTYGWARFVLRSGGIGDSTDLRIWVSNKKDNLTFDSRFNPDGTEIGGINPGWLMVPILPDGRSEQTLFAAGDYVACLADSNGGQPECNEFNIGNAYVTTVPFLGHAISHDEKGKINDLSIYGYLGNGDVNVEWIKPVIVGYHPFTYPAWEQVIVDVAAYDETVIDTPAHTEYRVRGHWDYHMDYDHHSGWHTHHNWDHSSSWSSWSDTAPDYFSEIPSGDKQTREIEAVTHTVHHDAVTHTVTHPAVTVQIPEYGFEIYIEIDGAHLNIDNPNRFDVNVDYAFDINYHIDNRPFDPLATPNQIKERTMHYTGSMLASAQGTTGKTVTLVPDIDNAVMVVDWSHYGAQYMPTLENAKITGTAWS